MTDYGEQERPHRLARCCPCGGHEQDPDPGVTRRGFLGGAALAGMALRGLSWPALSAVAADGEPVPQRRPLVVKPILIHKVCTRRPQTSWRIWGGIQTEQDAQQEVARIQNELAKLQSAADFPVRFLPVTAIRGAKELDAAEDLASADVLILYAAGDYWFAGYMAFCESDFVVIPTGILAANIAGRPMFLNDPCYPQHGVIALAHCTAPRMMDGKTREPARIVTHYESDYGAAPKVEMHKGQKVTNLIPDFQAKCLAGFVGEIVDAPFLPICRSQIVVRFACDSKFLARQMRGYHWITIYGDYLREVEYAVKRTKIAFETLG